MTSIDRHLRRLASNPPTADESRDFALCSKLRQELEERSDEVGDVFESLGGDHRVVVGAEARTASVPDAKGRLLYRLTRLLHPRRVVEFGSAFGVSGAFVARALEANGAGRLTTVEGSPSRHRIATATIERAAPGRCEAVLGYFDDHLDLLTDADLVFIDGNHQPEPTRRYVAAVQDRAAASCVVVLDDVLGWSPEFEAMWRDLERSDDFALRGVAAGMGVLTIGEHRVLAGRRDPALWRLAGRLARRR